MRPRITAVLAATLLLWCLVSASAAGAQSPPAPPTSELSPAPPPAASPDAEPKNKVCQLAPIGGDVCDQVVDGVTTIVPGAGPANAAVNEGAKVLDAAGGVFAAYNPKNIIETWAVGAARSSAEFLTRIQEILLKVSKPDFTAKWFTKQYGVTFGIGLVLMAFALLAATHRIGRGGPEAMALLRESGFSAALYVPAMMLLPVLVTTLSDIAYSMAGWFGTSATGEADSAIRWWFDTLSTMESPDQGIVGGTLGLLAMAGLTFVAGFLALIELTIAQYGQYIVTLLLPVVAALGIYPPWRRPAKRMAGILVGLLLMPVVLFFAFWVLWGAAAGLGALSPGADRFNGMLFVAVATVVAVATPLMLGFLMPLVGADHAMTTRGTLSGMTHTAGSFGRSQGARLRGLAVARSGSGSGGAAAMTSAARLAGPAGAAGAAVAVGVKKAAPSVGRTSPQHGSRRHSQQSGTNKNTDRTAGGPAASDQPGGPSSGAPPAKTTTRPHLPPRREPHDKAKKPQ